jgi:hypothetical protein
LREDRRDISLREPSPGLCERCRHGRTILTDRESRFWLCQRSATDPRFPKYPVLPVLQCIGYEPALPHDQDTA